MVDDRFNSDDANCLRVELVSGYAVGTNITGGNSVNRSNSSDDITDNEYLGTSVYRSNGGTDGSSDGRNWDDELVRKRGA